MRLAIIAVVLAIGILLAANQVTAKEIARVITFPGHVTGFNIFSVDNTSWLSAALYVNDSDVDLLGIPVGGSINWYKVVPLSPGRYFSLTPVLLHGGKVYVLGMLWSAPEQIKQLRPRLFVGVLSLRELRGETSALSLGKGNKTLGIIPVGSQLVETSQGTHVLYLVADLVRKESAENTSSTKRFSPAGFMVLRIGLEKMKTKALTFPVENIVVGAQRVSDGIVYVAGINGTNILDMAQQLRNTSLAIGAIHGNTLNLHYYSVPGCDIPVSMTISDNILYLGCVKPDTFSLGLMAINLTDWRPLWAVMYNVTTVSLKNVVIGRYIYALVMNGLLIVDRETGKPVKALVTTIAREERAAGVANIVDIGRLGNEYYAEMRSIVGDTVVLVPLKLVVKAKCIQVEDIVFGETKIAPKPLKIQPLGTKTIQGQVVNINTSQGPSLLLVKYTNVLEKEAEIKYPVKCRPQGFPTLTTTITATTRIITLTATTTTTPTQTTIMSINMTRPVSKEHSATETGPIIHHSATSSVNPATSTPGNKTGASAISSTPVATSSAKAVNSHDWKRTTIAAALVALAVIGVVILLMRRK